MSWPWPCSEFWLLLGEDVALTSGHESAKLVEDWVYGLQEEPLLQGKLSPEDRKKATALVHRLHVRAGHPSNKLLANVLRARGAHLEVVKIALGHERTARR